MTRPTPPRLAIVAALLCAAAAPAMTEPVPKLNPGEKWLTVASTQDIDTAIGIAGYYSITGARVMRAKNGWFAVALGPFQAADMAALKKQQPELEDVPADALLSDGANYTDVAHVQKPQQSAGEPLVEYTVGKPVSLSDGKLLVGVSLSGDEENPGPTQITGTIGGEPAFTFATPSDFSSYGAAAGLLRLDSETEYPQLVVTRYTGGAHCCTKTWFVTKPKDSAGWVLAEGAALDGEGGYSFRDVDGNGTLEMLSVDNNFLYTFAPYVESVAPTRYAILRGGTLEDVTDTPAFAHFVRQDLAAMEFQAKLEATRWHNNGFLAAWVATKILAGEGADAWSRMEKSYDRNPDFGPQECSTGGELDKCPEGKVVPVPFPRALAQFLSEAKYGPLPEAAQALVK